MKTMTVKDAIKAVLDRILLVVLIPLVAISAAAFISYNVLEPTYTAKTTMYVLNRQNDEALAYSDLDRQERC